VGGATASDGKTPDVGGTAGTTGTGGNSGEAGATGTTSQTGGATSLGGTTGTGTTFATGGSALQPDAAPDLAADVPPAVSCSLPKAPVNGTVQAPSLAVGGLAKYSCDTGYGTPTVASRTCQSDGTWSGTDPLCTLIDCGPAPSIANSKVEVSATTYNATAKYTCDPGYTASAATTLTCESSGRWSTASFFCNPVDCGLPPAVANADVIALTTVLGSVATTKCKTGFALTGTLNSRTCQVDGTWSPQIPACHVVDCGAPPLLANGTVVAPKTTFNEVASYSCSSGFTLSGLSARACQADETWFGAAPTCVAITPKLTVNKAGSGLGSVVSSSSTVINCGTTCVATLGYNTAVTITATADAGQSFVGWDSPACKGKQACTIQMTKDTVVNAVFSPPPNIMFVTSAQYPAKLGGLAGADAICAARATAAGLAGTYKAWLSTSTVNAKDRLGTASGWVRPDGKPVLSQIKDIESSKVFYPPDMDESGQIVGIKVVITGTGIEGTKLSGSNYTTCADWTSNLNDAKLFGIGNSAASSFGFTSYSVVDCTWSGRLYCFGTDRTAFVAPDPTTPGRRAFTTEAQWSPGVGIESADALCQKEASDAGLTGTFRALLSPTGASAASRFTGSEPWYRMDGLPLAASATAFFTNMQIDVAPNLSAKGQYLWSGFHWAGGQNLSANGTNDRNCSDWKSTLASDLSYVGYNDNSLVGLFFGANTSPSPCNGANHLVCLQTP
jgi:CUB/sushi domain-containing protein